MWCILYDKYYAQQTKQNKYIIKIFKCVLHECYQYLNLGVIVNLPKTMYYTEFELCISFFFFFVILELYCCF